jgi:hypothetical protein
VASSCISTRASPSIIPAPVRRSAPTLLWNTVRAIRFADAARAATAPRRAEAATGSSSPVGGSTQ